MSDSNENPQNQLENPEVAGEFTKEILRDLAAKGLTEEALQSAFRDEQAKVRPAVVKMLRDAAELAVSADGECSFEDLFGE